MFNGRLFLYEQHGINDRISTLDSLIGQHPRTDDVIRTASERERETRRENINIAREKS